MESIIILITCITLIIICIWYCVYRDNREFYVEPNTIAVLSTDNVIYNKKLYSHSSNAYKKRPNENVNVFHIESKYNYLWTYILTSDKKSKKVQIEYSYAYDLTHFIETIENYGLSSYKIKEKLEENISSIVKFVTLQNDLSMFYDYTKMDNCIDTIQSRLETYLLKKQMFIDVHIRSISLVG